MQQQAWLFLTTQCMAYECKLWYSVPEGYNYTTGKQSRHVTREAIALIALLCKEAFCEDCIIYRT